MESKKKYYCVARGRNPGIFTAWYGPAGAEAQIRGFAGARYKGFATIEEARRWLADMSTKPPAAPGGARRSKTRPAESSEPAAPAAGTVLIYTDGGCLCNPGPGGYGVVVLSDGGRREYSGGYRHTTNNRMELMACIEGLKTLTSPTAVTIYSDSKYVVDGITKGWARRWRAKGWMRTPNEAAENYDLWEQLLDLCERHTVACVWVKGHAGNPENECCDRLATRAATGKNLAVDTAYVTGKTRITD
jgi:ribonuclease HI